MDGRSDAKGPEPETVVQGEMDGVPYAFIVLERFSGMMVYDLFEPVGPKFVSLLSSCDFTEGVAGDVSPEGLEFILVEDSPTKKSLACSCA
ncbi:choice-of-anchor I domain-containing protein [Oceanobacillus halophilus]|uniref:Choice-of-anchor I domain-containing protein n=1 Tax=Oceanobacillus halophilus TaxID=930130 RepID=A0A495A458_9BACI|nr:hypothetical protein [Oceanobacillus halophilus]RKQ34326.1 hypothetical protein D8M06_08095 [Oceanobacillus halophilus]